MKDVQSERRGLAGNGASEGAPGGCSRRQFLQKAAAVTGGVLAGAVPAAASPRVGPEAVSYTHLTLPTKA